MSKLTFALLLAVATIAVQGLPFQSSELAEAARSGNWDEFRRLLAQSVGQSNWPAPLSGDVKNLRGGPDRQVFGHSVSTYQSSSNIDGNVSEFKAGHKVTNNNGDIAEYDFTP